MKKLFQLEGASSNRFQLQFSATFFQAESQNYNWRFLVVHCIATREQLTISTSDSSISFTVLPSVRCRSTTKAIWSHCCWLPSAGNKRQNCGYHSQRHRENHFLDVTS